MKLKLLLCYVLLVCSNCVFIVADDSEDTIEDDDAPELVASPIQAMGSVPHKITKKMITKNAAAQRAEIASSDPYAKVQSEPSRIIVSSGDPYAKSFSGTDKTSSIQGDPYATIGSTQLVETKKSSGKEIQDYKKRDDLKKLTPPDSFTSMLFGSFSNGNNPFGSDAQAVVKAIDKEVKLKEKELKSVAEERLASVTKEISVEAAKLRKEADAAARSIKERTEGSVQALLKTAEARIDSLNKEVVSESIKLKQKAAEKALTVLDEMEQRAALRRAEERKRALAATFGLKEEVLLQKEPKRQQKADFIVQKDETSQSVVPDLITKKPNDSTSTVIDTSSAAHQPMLRVSAEWKNDLSRRFYQDMTAMKNIILEAESPAEAQDFLKKFEEQNKWFDLTLRSTRLVSDTQYAQLIAKQSQLDKLMQAQQSADDYLEKLTKNMVIDRSQMKKMRLGLLYELNAKMQQRAAHLDREVRESALPDDEINSLVKRTLSDYSQQFREITAQFPDVEVGNGKPQLSMAAVPLMAKKLEQELEEVKADMATSKQELAATQEKLTDIQGSLEKEKIAKDEIVLQNTDLIKKNTHIKEAALEFIDKQARDNTDKEVELAGVVEDNSRLKTELTSSARKNSTLNDQKGLLVRAVEEARRDYMDARIAQDQVIDQAQKTVRAVQRQTQQQVRNLRESNARVELSLTADLRQAHEKITHLTARQSKLVQELEQQRQKTARLKLSLKDAQEVAGKAGVEKDLANQSLAENNRFVKHNVALRKQAESRAKVTEELAQKTIDSINGFLTTKRRSLIDREAKLSTHEDFLEAYRQQLSQDKEMLERLKKETRKVVEHSADLSDSLSEQFIQMQEQIEKELKQAHVETAQELSLVNKRLDTEEAMAGSHDLVNEKKIIATAVLQKDTMKDKQLRSKIKNSARDVMPGAKQLASKRPTARMPGLMPLEPV